jgi:hypothetical protein
MIITISPCLFVEMCNWIKWWQWHSAWLGHHGTCLMIFTVWSGIVPDDHDRSSHDTTTHILRGFWQRVWGHLQVKIKDRLTVRVHVCLHLLISSWLGCLWSEGRRLLVTLVVCQQLIKRSNGEQVDLILIGGVIDLVQNLNCTYFGIDEVFIFHAP